MSALAVVSPLGLATRWSTRSQEHARRNAMAACTILTSRRIERLEVEEFVADYLARRAPSTTPTSDALAGPVGQVG